MLKNAKKKYELIEIIIEEKLALTKLINISE